MQWTDSTQGLVVQLVRTRNSHQRGHRFESCQDHKKQAIVLEKQAKNAQNHGVVPKPGMQFFCLS